MNPGDDGRNLLPLACDDLPSSRLEAQRHGIPARPGAIQQTERARGVTRRQSVDAIAVRLQCIAKLNQVVRRIGEFTLEPPLCGIDARGSDGYEELIGAV